MEELIRRIKRTPHLAGFGEHTFDGVEYEGAEEKFSALIEAAKREGIVIKQNDKDPLWDFVRKEAASEHGLLIRTSPMAFSNLETKTIMLPEKGSKSQLLHSLIHEMSHVLGSEGWEYSKREKWIHQTFGIPPQGYVEEEIAAEATVWLVLKHFKLNSTIPFGYLRGIFDMDYKPWDSEEKLRRQWKRVEKVSKELIGMMEERQAKAAA